MNEKDMQLLNGLASCPKIGTTWRHYKGSVYCVVGSAIHESTLLPLVIYALVDDIDALRAKPRLPIFVWARPLREWEEPLENGMVRFVEVKL